MQEATVRWRWLLLASLTCLMASTGSAQQRDRSAEDRISAVIRGAVFSLDGGTPLPDARIQAVSESGRENRTTATDRDGRYELAGLPAGHYTVSAAKPGYVQLELGQRRAFDRGVRLDLKAGQKMSGVDFYLPRGSVMTGHLLDPYGQAAVGSGVRASRLRFSNGRWDLTAIGRAVADDRGEFRVFGLPPGDYYLEADSDGLNADPRIGHAATYYPGTADISQAQRVRVGLGEEVAGLHFSLIQIPVARVRGRVTDDQGWPRDGTWVSLLPRHPPHVQRSVRSARPGADGTFVVEGVAPGEYVLYASTAPADGRLPEFATAGVIVAGADIAGLILRTSVGASARGHLVVDAGQAPPFAAGDLQVFSMPLGPADVPIGRGFGRVQSDWTFTVGGMADAQVLRVHGLPAGWTLKAVVLNGTDVTDTPIDLPPERVTDGFRLLVTDRTTRVLASVTDGNGNAAQSCTALIFADDPARWTFPSRFVRVGHADQHGAFEVVGLPPEQYLALALEDVPEGAWTDPDFLARLRRRATRFTLSEGETRTLRLTLSTADGR